MNVMVANAVLGVHVIAACLWLGGMTFDVLVRRGLRNVWKGDERSYAVSTKAVGGLPGRVIWAALAIAVLTGLYNLTWYVPGGIAGIFSYLPQAPWLVAKLATVGTVLVACGLYFLRVFPRMRRANREGWPSDKLKPILWENYLFTYICIAASFVAVFVAVFM